MSGCRRKPNGVEPVRRAITRRRNRLRRAASQGGEHMHKLKARLVTPCAGGARRARPRRHRAARLRRSTSRCGTLTNVGYPEFIAMAAAEYKKTHPDVNIIFETSRTRPTRPPSRSRCRLGAARRVLQLGRRGCRAAGARRPRARHHRSTAPRQAASSSTSREGWLSLVRVRRQELRHPDRRGVEVLLLRQGLLRRPQARRRRRRSAGCSTSARRSAPSIPRSCPGRSATPSAGSSTTSSPCSTSACSAPRRRPPTMR